MYRSWVGNLIGLVVAVLLGFLVAPLFPHPADGIIAALCWIAAAVFAILLLVGLLFGPDGIRGPRV